MAVQKQQKKVFLLGLQESFQLLAERVAEWQGVAVSGIKLWFSDEGDFISLTEVANDVLDAGEEVTFELR
jgi:hypothetical protein